jgi:hypothetical protein
MSNTGKVRGTRSPAVAGRHADLGGILWTSLGIMILGAVIYYSLFELPFQFPPRHPLVSASYEFGFNNAVAILALAGLLGLVAIVVFFGRKISEPSLCLSMTGDMPGRGSARLGLAIMAALYAALTYAMYRYNLNSAPWLMWETRHFLYRVSLMAVYGMRPYSQFQAEYGPLLTHSPFYMYLLLKPIGASMQQAYFACHLILNIAGLWCAYYLFSCAIMPSRARVVAFIVIALSGFALYMGLNGVLLRYLFPFASLLLGHRAVVRMFLPSRTRSALRWVGFGAGILLLASINILLSPEAAASFAVAWLAYGALMVRRHSGVLAVSIAALIAAGILCWMVLPAAYYESLLRFSEGANNLPLLPAAHLLLYILTMFLVVPPLLADGLRGLVGGQAPTAAICGALGILCVALAPGALGRCDPPHVLFYGMGASMLLMIRLSNMRQRFLFTTYLTAYGCVFFMLMQVINLNVFFKVTPRSLLSPNVAEYLTDKILSSSGTEQSDPALLASLDHYPRLGLPFATFGDPAIEAYVLSRRQLDPEYYISVVGIYTAGDLTRKFHDISNSEFLLVPRGLESASASQSLCDKYLEDLEKWFLYPAALPCRADSLDPIAAVQDFIAHHYTPVENFDSWVILRRLGDPPLASFH